MIRKVVNATWIRSNNGRKKAIALSVKPIGVFVLGVLPYPPNGSTLGIHFKWNYRESGAPTEKHCKRCDTVKPVAEFSKNKQAKDGLNYYCRACRSEMSKDTRRGNKVSPNASLAEIQAMIDRGEL